MSDHSYEAQCTQLRTRLDSHPWAKRLVCLSETDSTNSYAKALAAQGAAEGTIVISDRQHAGRGQKGRSFSSPPQLGLYISFVLRPQHEPELMQPFTLMAAVAACNAVEHVSGIRPQLKWPNDLFLGGKKLGGILTERTLSAEGQCIILGIGININHRIEDFPPELHEIASSMHLQSGQIYDRAALAAALVEEIFYLAEHFEECIMPYLEQYRADCLHLNRSVELHSDRGELCARCIGIDTDGALLLEHSDGKQERFLSGEVHIHMQ